MKDKIKRFQDKATKGTEIVIRKMCELVNCDYDTFDFEQPNWWEVYKWDKSQEEKFTKWLDVKVKNNKTIREALTNFPSIVKENKEQRKSLINWFLLSHGWAYKDF